MSNIESLWGGRRGGKEGEEERFSTEVKWQSVSVIDSGSEILLVAQQSFLNTELTESADNCDSRRTQRYRICFQLTLAVSI